MLDYISEEAQIELYYKLRDDLVGQAIGGLWSNMTSHLYTFSQSIILLDIVYWIYT